MCSRRPGPLALCLTLAWCVSVTVLHAQETAVPVADRANGAERVVVGRVTSVNATWQVNEFGDRLIVSTVRVAVDETLKGQAQATLDVDVEGGTIGNVRLIVSDETSFTPGERAVFYVKRNRRGGFVPHLRGQGLLKLDRLERVQGSSLTLAEIRRLTRAGAGR